MIGIPVLKAQNPIPSYNVPVYYRANFQETEGPTRARKKVHVYVQCGSVKTATCPATVWVYRLDMQVIYGPFTVAGGETLTFDVGEGEWGVYVESDNHVIVDVWIDEESKKCQTQDYFSELQLSFDEKL